jgi:protein MpaA
MEKPDAQHFVIENGRRSIRTFLEPLQRAHGVQTDQLGAFEINGENYSLPRLTFRGPNSSDPIRIGIFAAIHGDEPAGPGSIEISARSG